MPRAETFDLIERALETTVGVSSDYDLNPDISLAPNRKLRDAAVLIALIETSSGVRVYLTKRSSGLKHHPGQIAFPGGKVDPADNGFVDAALREAEEEIGLAASNIDVLGTLSRHETVTGFNVVPVLGRVRSQFAPLPEPGEVEEIFTVPLSFLIQPGNFRKQSRIWQNVPRYYYTVPYGPYYIWGATARMLFGLAERVDSCTR